MNAKEKKEFLEENGEMLIFGDGESDTEVCIFCENNQKAEISKQFQEKFRELFEEKVKEALCCKENGTEEDEDVIKWINHIYPVKKINFTEYGINMEFDNFSITDDFYDDSQGVVIRDAESCLKDTLKYIQNEYKTVSIYGCVAYLYCEYCHGPSSVFYTIEMPSSVKHWEGEETIMDDTYEEIYDSMIEMGVFYDDEE